MSTYWYFECLDHEPPLRSADEVEQHTSGLDRILELAHDRQSVITATQKGFELSGYFERSAVSFLTQHPKCQLRLVSEYGETRDVSCVCDYTSSATAPKGHE